MKEFVGRLYRYNTTPGSPLRSIIELLLVWRERSRQRNALKYLDDRLLRDIGISRADAEWEFGKRFWQP